MNGDTNRHDDDFLVGALHGAADGMPGGETDEVHLQFGVVRDRIRRRRVAKTGALGAGALAVAGALVVGAAQLTPLGGETMLPADPTPSPSASAAPGPAPLPEGFAEGYAPSEIYAGTGLECGAEVRPGLLGGEYGLNGYGIGFRLGGFPDRVPSDEVTLTEEALAVMDESQAGGVGTLDLPPGVAWARDGRIVSLSRYFDPEPVQLTFDGAGEGHVGLTLGITDTCRPPEGAGDVPSSEPVRYEHVLAPGEYAVYPILWTDITAGPAAYVSGGPTTVTVLEDGWTFGSGASGGQTDGAGSSDDPTAGSTGGGADPDGTASAGDPAGSGAECSAMGMVDKSDFSFEPDPVARTAQELVNAARTCDRAALEEIATPGVTRLHRSAEVGVAERFALPERGGEVYAKLTLLLSGTAVVDPGTGDYVFPTAASTEYRQDPVAWDYAVELGFATQAQADEWRAAGIYEGWQLSISPDGTWRTFLGPAPD